ncbi:hypothetical protein HNP40_001948 [Mycobacteroides chelonae]|nr:hypothetical protein [Mycobacteroides chelonae]
MIPVPTCGGMVAARLAQESAVGMQYVAGRQFGSELTGVPAQVSGTEPVG